MTDASLSSSRKCAYRRMVVSMENENDKKHEAASKLASLFTGWGVPGSVARILAGAIIGALAAVACMSQSGCSVRVDMLPDGAQSWEGVLTLPNPATVTPEK